MSRVFDEFPNYALFFRRTRDRRIQFRWRMVASRVANAAASARKRETNNFIAFNSLSPLARCLPSRGS